MNISQYEKIFGRMIASVVEHQSGRAEEFTKRFTENSFSPGFAEIYSQLMGPTDIFSARENAVLRGGAIRTKDSFEKLMAENPREFRLEFDDDEGKYTGKSMAAGSKMVNPMVVVTRNDGLPGAVAGGPQAFTKLYDAFFSESLFADTPEKKRKVTDRNKRSIDSILKDLPISIEEFLDSPESIPDAYGKTFKEDIHAILDLQKMADERKKELVSDISRIIYGNTAFVSERSHTAWIAAESNGQFFGYFERNFDELPEVVQIAFDDIQTNLYNIPDTDFITKFIGLSLYYIQNNRISKEDAISPYQADIQYFLNLPESHDLRQKYGTPSITHLAEIFEKNEVTLEEASIVFHTKVFGDKSVADVRYEINKLNHEMVIDEILPYLDTFKELFFDGEKWKEDSVGHSLPAKRLKESKFGDDLVKAEFDAIRDMFRLDHLTSSSEELYKAVSILDLSDILKKVTASGRKTQSERTYRGSEYQITEEFTEKYGIDFEEFVKRCNSMFSYDTFWSSHKDEIKGFVEDNIFKDYKSFDRLSTQALKLISVEEHSDTNEKANSLKDHWLRKRSSHFRTSKPYWKEKEFDEAQARAEEFDTLDKLESSYNGDSDSLKSRLKSVEGNRYINRSSDRSISGGSIVAMAKEHKIEDLTYVTPEGLETQLEAVANYRRVDTPWVQKARFLDDLSVKALLSEDESYSGIIHALSGYKEPEKVYVDNSLIEEVNTAYKNLKETVDTKVNTLKNATPRFQEAAPEQMFRIKISGTNVSDRDFVYETIGGMTYNGKEWESFQRAAKTKASIASVVDQVNQYNAEKGKNLQVIFWN